MTNRQHHAAAGAHEAAAAATECRMMAERLHEQLGCNESQRLIDLALDLEIGCQQAALNTSAEAQRQTPDEASRAAAQWAADAPVNNDEDALAASEAAAEAHYRASRA